MTATSATSATTATTTATATATTATQHSSISHRDAVRFWAVDKKSLQTSFSVKASDFAEMFRAAVGGMRVGPHGYIPDLTKPEGPSTGGGVQALQHVRLVPPETTMPTLVVGQVNQRQGTAELRTLHYVDVMCRERFKQGAPLDPTEYANFVQTAQSFLAACGFRVSLASPPAELAAKLAGAEPSSPPPAARSAVSIVVVVGMLGALAGVVYWLFLRK